MSNELNKPLPQTKVNQVTTLRLANIVMIIFNFTEMLLSSLLSDWSDIVLMVEYCALIGQLLCLRQTDAGHITGKLRRLRKTSSASSHHAMLSY